MKTWPYYSPALRKDMDALLKEGGSLSAYRANKAYGLGPKEGSWAWKLEREIEKRFKVKHAVVVNSGTAALHAALVALDVRGGDVVTSPYTFSATASAILLAGGTPRFADVDPYTFCITKETVKHAITKRTKAILPVHLFGGLADVDGLSGFGVPVVEDACQAVGARSGSRWSGGLGLAGAYSFNGAKNIPGGEGGALVTNDAKVAERACLLINHAENYGTEAVGYNYRLAEPMALIAWHGLMELGGRNKRRQDLATAINIELGKTDFLDFSIIPQGILPPKNVYYVYAFDYHGPKAIPRAEFIKRMAKRGIACGAGYIDPTLDSYKAFVRYYRKDLSVAHELSSKTLCLLYCLSPDKPLSYAKRVAIAMKESLA